MESQRAKQLLEKYLNGTCTPEEQIIFESWYNKEVANRGDKPGAVDYMEMETRIYNRLPGREPSKIVRLRWVTSVAAAIALVAFGLYFFKNNDPVRHAGDSILSYANDVAPGGNKATLTLANGKTINLNDAKSGIVIKVSGLTYDDGTAIEDINTKRNEISTISTPRGGQYNVELPDGTTVSLNAASTLKFPSSFSGLANRRVELAGEGYFQVAKDKQHPFIVESGGQQVEVLGTHFNVTSYADEKDIKTTLIEGSVKVSSNGKSKLLRPSQQSMVTKKGISVRDADTEEAIAWKNGLFIFDNEPLASVMRKVERWYDVEIVYANGIPDDTYIGSVSRFDKVSTVLHVLESTGSVHFKIEGRRITVHK
ncbi:MAG: FecR domain-containing protein [Bacteroidota bacterium]